MKYANLALCLTVSGFSFLGGALVQGTENAAQAQAEAAETAKPINMTEAEVQQMMSTAWGVGYDAAIEYIIDVCNRGGATLKFKDMNGNVRIVECKAILESL